MGSIQHLTKQKLVREDGWVIVCATVVYPQLVGEGEGVLRFNQTYESAAQSFLEQGLTHPIALAQKERAEGGRGFARYEVICDMKATDVSTETAANEGEILVEICVSAGKRYSHLPPKTFQETHVWTFPEGCRKM